MTQFAPGPTPNSEVPVPPVPKTSVLAIISLVFALLFCIPFAAPAIGMACGVIALVAIGRSAGRRKGNGLAIAGLIISALVMMGHVGVVVAVKAVKAGTAELARSAEGFIRSVEAGDFVAAREYLTDETAEAVSDEQLGALQDRLAASYGSFEGAAFDLLATAYRRGLGAPAAGWDSSAMFPNTTSSPGEVIPLPIKMEFSESTLYGLAHLVGTSQPNLPLRLQSLTVVDDDGIWQFPEETHEADEPEDDPPAI